MSYDGKVLLITFCGSTAALFLMKWKRMDSWSAHLDHLELRRRADFWAKGNSISDQISDCILTGLEEDVVERQNGATEMVPGGKKGGWLW